MTLTQQLARLGLATLLGTGVAILPISFDPAAPGGLELSKAWAKDGDRGDDNDNDDDNDDNDDDDRGGDDNSGRGNSDDDDRDDDRGSDSTDDSPSTGIEVATANGGRIEIENGIFELKNAAGETIVERPATAADYAALGATPPATAPATATAPDDNGGRTQIRVGRVVEIEQTATSIEIRYSRGWKEEIENGVYELKDPANRTVIERPATAADWDRLVATAG